MSAKPIASLEPIIMVEGQSYSLAATCRSVAKPMAGLSWDTELPGRSKNHSFDDGVASIQFSLHPLRSMNGQKLDCLVWHPSQKGPHRITNNLTVHCESSFLMCKYRKASHNKKFGVKKETMSIAEIFTGFLVHFHLVFIMDCSSETIALLFFPSVLPLGILLKLT